MGQNRPYALSKRSPRRPYQFICYVAAAFLCALPLFSASRSLRIYIQYPDDQVVMPFTIRGSGIPALSWSKGIELDHLKDNLWGIEIYNVSASKELKIEFKSLLKDQVWQLGSNFIIDDVWDKEKNEYTFYPWFITTRGTIKVFDNIYSKELNNSRSLAAYLPPKYYENPFARMKNVLFMNDGNNVFNLSCTTCCPNGCWFCEDTLTALILNGDIKDDLIVVGIYNTPLRMEEYTYSRDPTYGGGKADLYLDFIESTVIPFVENTFRLPLQDKNTDTHQRKQYSLGILGSSLGGLLSCYAGQTRPNIYDYAGCMSSSFWWNNKDFNSRILRNGTTKTRSSSAFYLDSGNEGPGKDDEAETAGMPLW